MPDRLFYPLIVLVVILMVVLADVWPQGDGARSLGVFGHTPTQQTEEATTAAARQQDRAAAAAALAKGKSHKANRAAAAAIKSASRGLQ
jgi:hypothetical protein